MEPFISVITVSLNAAATIEDTIASVSMQQANFKIEHICVDGGSNDGSRKIIDRWTTRVSHLSRIYEPDTGIFDAMNRGLRAAKGEYVLYLNADDFLVAENTLARAVEGLIPGAPENPDLIAGDVSMGTLGRRGIWRHRRAPRLLGRINGSGLFPVHQGLFTKRRLLDECGGFNPRLRTASDVNLYYDLESKFRLSTRLLRSDIAFMRAGGSANASIKIRYLGTIDIYRHLLLRHSATRAAAMVFIKTMQSFCELRYGICPHKRWFAQRIEDSSAVAIDG
jgi:glycosyltransferase involved in cell wall biosynthesis